MNINASRWNGARERYRNGDWRAQIFADLILEDASQLGDLASRHFLDIGCGSGFDRDVRLTRLLAENCGVLSGVEPDDEIAFPEQIAHQFRTTLEDASIAPGSIDIAYAVMVLEHLSEPDKFVRKLYDILRPGGIFWGFTVDARHWFAIASQITARTRLKHVYLRALRGKRGDDRYENYPTHYRFNTPAVIGRLAAAFSEVDIINFHKIGQVDYYFPALLRPISRAADRVIAALSLPGSVMAVRLVK